MGELQFEKLQTNIPLGKLKTKLQASVYVKNGHEFRKTKEYVEKDTLLHLYSIEDGIWGHIGDNRYVTELNEYHFDISYGSVTTLTDSVHTCSRNGFIIRKLKSGTKLNVKAIYHFSEIEILYKVGDKEYIHNSMPVKFVMGEILILDDGLCHLENDDILRFTKGEIMPYQNVRHNQVQLLTGEWINPQSLNSQLLLF